MSQPSTPSCGIEPWIETIVEEMLNQESFGSAKAPAAQMGALALWARVLSGDSQATAPYLWAWWNMSTHTGECGQAQEGIEPLGGELETVELTLCDILRREEETYLWGGYGCECIQQAFPETGALELYQDQQCREVLADWLSVRWHERRWRAEPSKRNRRRLSRALAEASWSVEHNHPHWDTLRESQGLIGISGEGPAKALIRTAVAAMRTLTREITGARPSGPVQLVELRQRRQLHQEASLALMRDDVLRGESSWMIMTERPSRTETEHVRHGSIPETLWRGRERAEGAQALRLMITLLDENAELSVSQAAKAAEAAMVESSRRCG